MKYKIEKMKLKLVYFLLDGIWYFEMYKIVMELVSSFCSSNNEWMVHQHDHPF